MGEAIREKKINKFCLYLYAFLVLYNPSFFKNSNAYLDYSLTFIYWIIGLFALKPEKETGNSNKSIIIRFGVIGMLFFCMRTLFAGTSLFDVINLRIIQSASVIVSMLSMCNLALYFRKKGLTKEEQISFILNVCMIQFAFVLIMIISPDFRMKVLNVIYITNKRDFSFTIAKRVYGIMSNYTYAGSVFHGFMAFVALYTGFRTNNSKYYFYIPFLLITIFLNGRIGLIVFLASTSIFLFYNLVTGNHYNRLVKIIMLLILLVIAALLLLPVLWPNTYRFFLNGFFEMFSFAQTGVASEVGSSDIDDLFGQFNTNFNIKSLLIGNGHRIQTPGDIPNGVEFTGVCSDMGLLNDMYMGGIIYMLLLRIPLFKIITKSKSDAIEGAFNIVLIVILIIASLKGEVYRSTIIVGSLVYVKYALDTNAEKSNSSTGTATDKPFHDISARAI